MRRLKIGILGSRGIPNRYGGYEQCAEYLSVGLADKGHEVYVYNSSNHEYKGSNWKGVQLIHCNDPENKLGTIGQFIYDWNCISDARKRDFDIILQLGYTSSSIWYWRWPKTINIVNMDGLEWKRSKYSKPVQKFLKYAEKLAANNADILIADSTGIQQHLKNAYNKTSFYIPYGSEIFTDPNESGLKKYALIPFHYNLLIARMEPENNIEMIIQASIKSRKEQPLVIVGSTKNKYGVYLQQKYKESKKIQFIGGVYDKNVINNLRYFSRIYFHGHSVGGTNPSLLEAMGCKALIAAHDNIFNKAILVDNAFYFSNVEQCTAIIKAVENRMAFKEMIDNNFAKIKTVYTWESITTQYEHVMAKL